MKFILLVSVAVVSVITVTSTEDVDAAWASFKLEHGKQYRNLHEETVRKAIFIENFNKIAEHNKQYEQGLVTYTQKINAFADLNVEERKVMKGYRKSNVRSTIDFEQFVPDPSATIPDSIDWRDKGAVTAVKNQGSCGSCWSFSSTGALESQYFLKHGKLPVLSEQNLLDCDPVNGGCYGGDMYPAFDYIHNNDGIDSESGYPYEAVKGSCRYNSKNNVTSLRGYESVEDGNEDYLKQAIATKGPIAVAMDASHATFDFYQGGVYYDSVCSSDDLDHAVLAVGYGSQNGSDYWLIKNSWGTGWGDAGYIKIARNKKNHCGIATEAVFPLLY